MVIGELVVVEGAHDISAVRAAVDAEVLATNGFALGDHVLEVIARARATCGVIVLTDPDPAGEQIRRRIEEIVGPCKHAFVARADCAKGTDIGIENAAPAVVRRALERAHASRVEARAEFGVRDLWRFGLQGEPGSRARRVALGRALGVGYGNARQLLRRLNHFGVERADFEAAAADVARLHLGA